MIELPSGPLDLEYPNIFLNFSIGNNLLFGEYSPNIPHNV